MPALGYLDQHPLELASRASPKRWSMQLLAPLIPAGLTIPSDYTCPDAPPNALDQGSLGACVAGSGMTIRDAQEHADWGKWLFVTGSNTTTPKTGLFLAYQWLKQGSPDGSYPGDGIPNVEGSYPEAFCRLALAYGIPDGAGKLHKISAYYSHDLASDADVAFIQAVLLTFGPVHFATPWLWDFTPPPGPNYVMPAPGGSQGGHAYTCIGWRTIGGVLYLLFMNDWGYWGTRQGLFAIKASAFYTAPLGPQIVRKTVDIKDAPAPPTPGPEGPMLAITDKVSRLLDSHTGAPLYKLDGTTQLTTIMSGPTNIASPFALAGGFYGVVVSVNGVLQLAALKASDCTNVRAQGDVSAWTAWLAQAPK